MRWPERGEKSTGLPAGDMGGTKTSLSLADVRDPSRWRCCYLSQDYPSLAPILQELLA